MDPYKQDQEDTDKMEGGESSSITLEVICWWMFEFAPQTMCYVYRSLYGDVTK